MRRWCLVGAAGAVLTTLGLGLAHAAGLAPTPSVDGVLLGPGLYITWMFILGDVGSPLDYIVVPLLISSGFNGILGAGLGCVARLLYKGEA